MSVETVRRPVNGKCQGWEDGPRFQPGSFTHFLRSPGTSQSLWTDFGLEPSGHFQRVTTAGCSQAQLTCAGVCSSEVITSRLVLLLSESFQGAFSSVDEKVLQGGKETQRANTQTMSLIDPSLILSFSSTHNRVPLKKKKRALEEICPKRFALGLLTPIPRED